MVNRGLKNLIVLGVFAGFAYLVYSIMQNNAETRRVAILKGEEMKAVVEGKEMTSGYSKNRGVLKKYYLKLKLVKNFKDIGRKRIKVSKVEYNRFSEGDLVQGSYYQGNFYLTADAEVERKTQKP